MSQSPAPITTPEDEAAYDAAASRFALANAPEVVISRDVLIELEEFCFE